MILTAEEMYKAFLLGIKKENSTIVPPSVFNLYINEEQDKWYKEKTLAIELDQKRIDDLQVLRSVTDGEYQYNGVVLNHIAPDTYRGLVFSLPHNPATPINYNWSSGGGAPSTQLYPRYRRLLNIQFKIYYVSNECDLVGESDWLDARILRSDQRTEILKNPFRKPKDKKLYYEIIDNKIRLITGTSSQGMYMRLEYLRYPININYSIVPSEIVNCELPAEQQQEIVDRAVLSFIERSKNQRYQTANHEYLKEQQTK